MTTNTPPAPAADLRRLALVHLDALGDDVARLGLAVAAYPGAIPPRAMERLLCAVKGCRAMLEDAGREVPSADGPGAGGAG
jgi:hypothetical protein